MGTQFQKCRVGFLFTFFSFIYVGYINNVHAICIFRSENVSYFQVWKTMTYLNFITLYMDFISI